MGRVAFDRERSQMTQRRVRGSLSIVFAALVLLVLAAVALAANAKRLTHYGGAGKLCQNNTPDRRFTACNGKNSFSFTTSPDGRKVTQFNARLGPLYCGHGVGSVTAKSLPVDVHGAFSVSGSFPDLENGKVRGTTRATIRGRFSVTGGAGTAPEARRTAKTAKVFYRELFHRSGSPAGRDCGAQVTGTAHSS